MNSEHIPAIVITNTAAGNVVTQRVLELARHLLLQADFTNEEDESNRFLCIDELALLVKAIKRD